MKRNLGLAVVGIAFIALIIYAQWPAIYLLLDDYNFIPHPEQLTELYFNSPQSLPKVLSSNAVINFSFVIHNMEGKAVTYPYRVRIDTPGGSSTVIQESSVSLWSDEKVSIPESFAVSVPVSDSIITVELPDQEQKIDFLLKKANP